MKKVTSITVWNDAVGKRVSITYSEISDSGVIIADNKRIDRVLTDAAMIKTADDLAAAAQELIKEA